MDEVSAAYVARLLALPSMREWEAAALADTTREPSHEADTSGGTLETLLEDRRQNRRSWPRAGAVSGSAKFDAQPGWWDGHKIIVQMV